MPMSWSFRRQAGRKDDALSGVRGLSIAAAVCALAIVALPLAANGQAAKDEADKIVEPIVGQTGKDSVWVPTPHNVVEQMLDFAKVTPNDLVIDLGSGDGRMVIAAARRGARAIGVEWDENLVALSQRDAKKAGVADKAEFVRHDMFTYDLSKATVMALYMLPEQMERLTPQFLALQPGTRIVINTFNIPSWTADETTKAESGQTILLHFVPARVEGTWRLGDGELTFKQEFQHITGTLTVDGKATKVEGRLRGEDITFTAGAAEYTGRVSGSAMKGEAKGATSGPWSAVRK